jgi:hypothetical protein
MTTANNTQFEANAMQAFTFALDVILEMVNRGESSAEMIYGLTNYIAATFNLNNEQAVFVVEQAVSKSHNISVK